MKPIRLLAALCMALLLGTAGCNAGAPPFVATTTPTPTNTLIPTNAPIPTATASPEPTATPEALLPLGTEVTVRGVTLRFTDARITKQSVEAGTSLLVVTAEYTGDIGALLNGPYHAPGVFYVDDGTSVKKDWDSATRTQSGHQIQIMFNVSTGFASLVLHSKVDTVWSMDLSSRIPPSQTGSGPASLTEAAGSCLQWNQVTSADVGKGICVTGYISQKSGYNDIWFPRLPDTTYRFTESDTKAFLFTLSKGYPSLSIGDCVDVVGVVKLNGPTIYMWNPTVTNCSP